MERDYQSASAEDWQVASQREAIIAPLVEKQIRSDADIQAAADALSLKRSWLFQLMQRYLRNPCTSTLLPKRLGRRPGSLSLSKEQEAIIQRQIDEFYLKPECPNQAALHRRVALACRREQIEVPSYWAVAARVSAIDPKVKVRLRQGTKAAAHQFDLVVGELRAELPLEIVQIDHTLADVIIVDDMHRLPIGRPWVSLVIDLATRVIPGFHITLEYPSSLTVSLVISHAVLPKERFLRERQVDQDWPVHGLPQRIHLDNGKEFHAQALQRGCQEHGMRLEYRPPLQPAFGGHIERLIGTMMGEVHLLPGTTFSSVQQKADYDSAGRAVMTLREFEAWFTWQVVGVYHQRVHSALCMTPLQAWKQAVDNNPGALRLPRDAKRFYLDFLPFQKRKIRRDGIRLFNIQYADPGLDPLAGRSSQKYTVNYDPRDLSRVYVKESPGQYLVVPYRDLRRPPITLAEHRRASDELRRQGRLSVNEDHLFAAIDAQRRLVEQAQAATQGARRKMQQLREVSSRGEMPDRSTTPVKSPKPEPTAEGVIRPYEYEIWDR